ncbi:MAG: insulinase family protein [Candidatus Levybacteria bacterium]|nr:insulinase family protein [Candidatus Levybacteria bacterium]
MKFNKKILPNGLRILTVPMPSFESATALVMVGAGSRYENKKNNGISHFLEHMAFKGTKTRPTFMEVAGLIDSIGGEFNAFTHKEYTGYYIKAGKNNIEICLDLLSDMLQNSLLDASEIEKEKGVIVEEINLYEDTPMRKISDIYENLLYADTPLGWDIAGEKDIVRDLKRDDFISYLNSFYSPSNMSVVVAGGVEPLKAVELIEKYFSAMKPFKTGKPLKIKESQKKPKSLLRTKKTEQAHLALGFRTVPINSAHKFALWVLSAVLGGGMSSRLFAEVREKRGLAYYIRSNSEHYTDAGSFVVTSGVDPKRAEEAIEVIISEIADLRDGKKKIKKDELKKAKESIKGHTVLELEDSRSASMFYAAQDILEKKIQNPDQVLRKIDKVTEEEIMEVAKKYLIGRGLNLALIGDFEDKGKFEKLLKL